MGLIEYLTERKRAAETRRFEKALGVIQISRGVYVAPIEIKKVEAPNNAVTKLIINNAEANHKLIDATDKLGTKAIIIMKNGIVVLSPTNLDMVKNIIKAR
jgi:regulator of extracellular matrix RemA (YlzA/DUF370 family)